MSRESIDLSKLDPQDVPRELRVETYFDFKAHPFAQESLFRHPGVNSVVAAIGAIDKYAGTWLAETIAARRKEQRAGLRVLSQEEVEAPCVGKCEVLLEEGAIFQPASIWGVANEEGSLHRLYLEQGVVVFQSHIYLEEGDVYIGSGTKVEPGAGIKGPAIIGRNNEIRQGAYLRGDVITGDECILRGEFKNSVIMDKANFPHPSYLGDSICGYMSHFGNQATAANLGIFEGLREKEQRRNVVIKVNSAAYDTGLKKMGIVLGDFSQVGCNSVSDPGTLVQPYTLVYTLTRISKGLYGPREVLKNKPMERGIIERAPFEE